MAKSRELYNNFIKAVEKLNEYPNQENANPVNPNQARPVFYFDINSAYINVLNEEEATLGRLYNVAEYDKRRRAAQDGAILVNRMVQLKATLSLLPGELPNHARVAVPGLVNDLRARTLLCFQQVGTLVGALLADGRYNEKQIHLMNRLVPQMEMVYSNPGDANVLNELNNLRSELDSLLETGTFSHYAYVVGRAFYGALKSLLGLAIMAASLTTYVGLALSVASALVTWALSDKIHWGPLSWGNQLFWSGKNTITGGPSFFQRDASFTLSNDMRLMNIKVEEILPHSSIPAPQQQGM